MSDYDNTAVLSVILESISSIKTQIALAREASRQHASRIQSIEALPRNSPEVVLSIGCDLWVSKKVHEAVAYHKRQIASYETKIGLDTKRIEKLVQAKTTLEAFAHIGTIEEGTVEEKDSCQIVEIQEELDEEGNILNVRLNNENHTFHRDEQEASQSELTPHAALAAENVSEPVRSQTEKTMASRTSSFQPSLNHELYELELIAGKFEDDPSRYEESESDDEQVQKNLEPRHAEQSRFDETESSEDDFENSDKQQWIPLNFGLNERLWSEVSRLRDRRQVSKSTSTCNTKKRVRFKDDLDISGSVSEIPTLSQEKGMPLFSCASKDAQVDLTAQNEVNRPDKSKLVSAEAQTSRSEVDNSISLTFSDAQAISTDVKEIEDPNDFAQVCQGMLKEEKRKKTSRFKQMVTQNPQQRPSGRAELLGKDQPSAPVAYKSSSQYPMERASQDEPDLDDLEDLVKAYNLGVYDTDLQIAGPIVKHPDDMRFLNRIDDDPEASLPLRELLKEKNLFAGAAELHGTRIRDQDVMTDILERDLDDNTESSINILAFEGTRGSLSLDSEVREGYSRLRRKLQRDGLINY